MVFGVGINPAASPSVADWLTAECDDVFGVVGSLVPRRFDQVVRVLAPPPCEDWWPEYQRTFEVIEGIGTTHTDSPTVAYYGVWEGHGFGLDEVLPNEEGAAIPRHRTEDRSYLLLEGPLPGVDLLRYPGCDEWRNPDLFWPADRTWFVATDVDFWSIFVAGPPLMMRDLESDERLSVEATSFESALPDEV